jgi:hypothetical protein
MARKKKEVYHVKPLTEGKKNIISALIDEYDIETAEDIQDALRDLLGGTIKSMLEAEMSEHLGYEKSERFDSDCSRLHFTLSGTLTLPSAFQWVLTRHHSMHW